MDLFPEWYLSHLKPGHEVVVRYQRTPESRVCHLKGVLKLKLANRRVLVTLDSKDKKFSLDDVIVPDNFMHLRVLHPHFSIPTHGLRYLADIASVMPGLHGGRQLRAHDAIDLGTYCWVRDVRLTLSEKDAACLEKDVCEFGERVHGFTLANIYKVVSIGKFVGMCFEMLPNSRVIPILLETWD